jgi:hypothetical protein
MLSFPSWLLPVLVFAVWFLWVFAAVAQVRARELRRGTPKDQRGGVSILPVIPLFPLSFWGVAWLADRFFAPWGSVVVGVLHLALAAAMGFTFVRDLRYCLHHERA